MDAEELYPAGANGALAAQGSGGGDVRQPARFSRRPGDPRDLPVRGLPEGGRSLDVVRIRSGVPEDETGCRSELREGFHSLFWLRSGTGVQFIDGKPVKVDSPTLTLVGQGQVYRYEDMGNIDGAVVSFGDDLLYEGSAVQVNPVWLVGRYGAQSVRVPTEDAPRIDLLVDVLAAEAQRSQDASSGEVQRHLLLTLLLLAQRYYDDARADAETGDDGDARLHRRFVALLERDYARHHDVDHYANALGVPPPLLARAMSNSTGRPTKALITDRVMLEASRLLRFTDLQIGEIASRVGLRNQFYFSRAFKQRYGESPQAYRTRVRDGARSPDAELRPALPGLQERCMDSASSVMA
ncbi:helix-turn-helix transcriptional regulator [Streptomyces sp. NPDC002888]|uniref:helix-turn-helix transcriptional regulator n=1 Tax=Streptomyces sp. NPDC002888 TaxID=3364668 RepID=UPI0036A6842F